MRKDGESTKTDVVIPGPTEVVNVVSTSLESSQYTSTVIRELTHIGLVLGTNMLPTSFSRIY